jgi:predicted RNA binding protein YcfA (HicA-like mRNA interferase family)
MEKDLKLYDYIMLNRGNANIPFDGVCRLLKHLGFEERIRGSHHIFTRGDIEEIINLQPLGAKMKPYQVKQIRQLMIKYAFGVRGDLWKKDMK